MGEKTTKAWVKRLTFVSNMRCNLPPSNVGVSSHSVGPSAYSTSSINFWRPSSVHSTVSGLDVAGPSCSNLMISPRVAGENRGKGHWPGVSIVHGSPRPRSAHSYF